MVKKFKYNNHFNCNRFKYNNKNNQIKINNKFVNKLSHWIN